MAHARFTLAELLQASGGSLVTSEKPLPLDNVRLWTDTRTLEAGDFFVPLRGPRFDGHHYLAQALSQGACGAFIDQTEFSRHPEWRMLPNLIAVDEPLQAYLAMARFHRRRVDPTVIGVVGSSGKTTTKEMLYAAFSLLRKTQCTYKNHNNEIGVSQTLLALQPDTQILVVEMAMRGPGEIALLARYAEPDIALVLNIGPEHIEFFGSLEKIAQAECEVFEGLDPENGVGVVNADDALVMSATREVWPGKLSPFSLSEVTRMASTKTGGITFTYGGCTVTLAVPGVHNVANALAVLKTGELIGFSSEELKPGLEAFTPVEGRGNRLALAGYTNAFVFNDCYNANPDSMKASIQAFLEIPDTGGRRIIVLGAMKELGKRSREYHEALGKWLATQTGIDTLFTVGEEGTWIADTAKAGAYPVYAAADNTTLVSAIQQAFPSLDNSLILLKASRSCLLEQIIPALSPAGDTAHRPQPAPR